MKIAFAADMSFSKFDTFPGEDAAGVAMAEPAAVLAKADFSIVNLENIIGDENAYKPIIKSGPNLISTEEFFTFIDALSPSAVGLANNHTFDYGKGALDNTLRLLDEHGYPHCGAGETVADAYRPVVFEKDGVRVAIFAVCENEFGTAGVESAGSAGYDLARVTVAIRGARADGCLPIVYFHGGNERYAVPSPGKVSLYRHFIDLGAAAVIAMHTHCPQGYEFYRGAPIVYSMGNFFFPAKWDMPKSWDYGYITELDIRADGIALSIVPYTFCFDGVRLLEGEEKAQFMRYMDFLNGIVADEKLVREYFDSWCVISGIGCYMEGLERVDDASTVTQAELVRTKNLFSCEAHNELMTNTFKLLYEGRLESAGKYIAAIEALQEMCVPE